ncbi:hypothetical protein NQ318_015207 [Aromia moschata]|uniref:Uncharacterized protein n=1 Tax=Aromia moschata TaxID=1265417 RepID=A0AAV8XL35_9CUCU|nr:hypothetical protein NQ318_015207 [Aromia moschata]
MITTEGASGNIALTVCCEVANASFTPVSIPLIDYGLYGFLNGGVESDIVYEKTDFMSNLGSDSHVELRLNSWTGHGGHVMDLNSRFSHFTTLLLVLVDQIKYNRGVCFAYSAQKSNLPTPNCVLDYTRKWKLNT